MPAYTLPAGTFGLYMLDGQPYVFGSASTPGGLPVGVQYQQLAAPSTPDMIRVVDVKAFDGKLYVVAEYDDGNLYHFYDGSRVTGWDTLGDANSSYEAVAEALAARIEASGVVRARVAGAAIQITAKTAGTEFTCTAAATDVDADSSVPTATRSAVTANVSEVEEVLSTGSVQITGGTFDPGNNKINQVTVNGVPLLEDPVLWTTSNNATANALAIEINNNSLTSGYSATAADDTVTISAAPGTGTTPNGYAVASVPAGDVTTIDANMADGVAYVAPVAQVDKVVIAGSSFDATDLWQVVVNGTTYQTTGRAAGTGTSVFVFKKRVWSTARSLLRYCQVNDPADWTTTATPASDAGFINISSDSEGAQSLVCLAKYYNSAAIFSRQTITFYQLFVDATNNALDNSLESTGTVSARSAIPYGNNDVYYLSDSGIRSIRAREGTDTPAVSDVGSALDPFVQEVMRAVDGDTLGRAVAIIEPIDGRYMLAVGDKIITLSYFPSSKITAWTYIEPGFSVTDFAKSGRELYSRAGDTIYIYGGFDGETYPDEDEQETVFETPFMAANDPAGKKQLTGFDAALEGDWVGKILVDPNDTQKVLNIPAGVLNRTTYHLPEIKIPGLTSHMAFRGTCASAGMRVFSSLAIHYDKEGAA
ncbi:hypothetical protein [Methyloceanibacter caenitepidi]|uniref:hypothetical protein n=1 Tax=Methyloceanibacter caenitepidi TaxID=1384459 RepID=UPI0012E056E1|nr:hypothetical protein [Methyloceanibacter caenitepidi]